MAITDSDNPPSTLMLLQAEALEMEGKLNLDGEILEASGHVSITATEPLEFIRL